eukprot:Pgem_evm1s5017
MPTCLGMFDSLWYQKYHNTGIDSHNQVVSFDKSNNREISNEITDRQPNNEPLFVTSTKPRKLNENLHDVDFKVQPSLSHLSQTETKENVGFNIKTVSEKRTDSYYQLFLNRKNNYLRSQFYDSFLKNIFNIEAPGKVQGLICNAIWNPSLGNTDDNIYSKIVQELEAQNSNLALVLKTYRGREILCNRHSKDPESIELFRLCIGGYGMFGIIIDIKLKTVKNCKLILDSIQCHVKNFDTIHKTLRDKKCIEVKMARLDISTCNFVNIYIFRKENENQIESSMPCNPRTLSQTGQLLYK